MRERESGADERVSSLYRQQMLFVLVAAAVDRAASLRDPVRGDPDSVAHAGDGREPGEDFAHWPGAGAGARPDRDLGDAGDSRIFGGRFSGPPAVARGPRGAPAGALRRDGDAQRIPGAALWLADEPAAAEGAQAARGRRRRA